MLLVFVAAVFAAGPLFAEPEYKKIQKDVQKLERTLKDLEEDRDKADKALRENRKKQTDATNEAEKKRLKAEARKLASVASDKADKVREQRQKLGDKQGELREAAADVAIKSLNADGDDLNRRLSEAIEAMDAWNKALGALPEVPELRSLTGIRDPQARAAIRDGDKKRLKDFRKWAGEETKRIDDEIGSIKKVAGKKDTYKRADAGAEFIERADDLKKTLESRKKRLKALTDTAKARLKELD